MALVIAVVATVWGLWRLGNSDIAPVIPFPGVVSIHAVDAGSGDGVGATGFVIAPGRVITNWHVIANASKVEIVVSSGKSFAVEGVLASDEDADIAVLWVPMPEGAEQCLRPAPTPAAKGDRVIIVPNPRHRVPTPMVAKIEAIRLFPQLGVCLSVHGISRPGWSGSAVLDSHGDVVGVLVGQFGEMIQVVPIERVVLLREYNHAMTLSEWASHQEPGSLESERLRWSASRLREEGDFAGALPRYKRAAELRPHNWRSQYQTVECLIELGRREELAGALDQFVTLVPEASGPLVGSLYLEAGMIEEAHAAFETALSRDPTDLWAQDGLAGCLFRLEEYDDARAAYEMVLSQEPADFEARYGVAECLYRLDRFDEAIHGFEAVVMSRPDDAHALRMLAKSWHALGRNREALRFVRKAVSIDPSNAYGYRILGSTLYRLKRWPEALEALNRARELDPTSKYDSYTIGQVYLEQGRWPEAIAAFQEADRLVPGENDTLHNLVAALLRAGRGDEAVSTAERMVAAHPKESLGYYVLADALEKDGKHDQALAAIDRGLAAAGANWWLYLLRGDIYDTLGKRDLAVLAYQESLRVEPGLPAAHENLVKVYVKLGDIAKAREELRVLEASDAEAAGRVRSLVPPE